MSKNSICKFNRELVDCYTANIDSLSTSLLTELFDNLPEALVVADISRRIIYVNSATEKLFGDTFGELYRNESRILYADERDFSEKRKECFNASSKKAAESYRIAYCRADGDKFPG